MRAGLVAGKAAVIPWQDSISYDSIVDHDPFSFEWNGQSDSGTDTTTPTRWAATVEAGGIGANMARNAPANDRTGPSHPIPAGTTSLDASIGIMLAPGDTPNQPNTTLHLGFYTMAGALVKTLSCAAQVGEIIFTLHTVPGDGWASGPGNELYCRPLLNEDGRQARVIITTPLKVVPNGATDPVFTAPEGWQRIGVTRQTISNNADWVATDYGRGPLASPHSTMAATVNAARLLSEHWSSLRFGGAAQFGYTAQNAAAEVMVDVTPAGPGAGSVRLDGGNTMALTLTPVVLDGATHEIKIVNGPAAMKSGLGDWLAYGTQVRALYASKTATVTVHQEDLTVGVEMVEDDSTGGLSADEPALYGWVQCRREGFRGVAKATRRVINRTMGSRKFENALDVTALVARWKATIASNAVPFKLVWLLQSNSARDGVNPITHYNNLVALWAQVHTQMPQAIVFAYSMILRFGSGPSDNFEEGTGNSYREGTQTSLRAGTPLNSTFVVYTDGRTLVDYPADFLGDGTHQKDSAMAKMATNVFAVVDAGYVAPPAWLFRQVVGIFGAFEQSGTVNVAGQLTRINDANSGSLFFAPLGANKASVVNSWPGGGSDGTQCWQIAAGGQQTLRSSVQLTFGMFERITVGKFTGVVPGETWTQGSDTETGLYGGTGDSSYVRRNGIYTNYNANAGNNWLNTGTPHVLRHLFAETNASHKVKFDVTDVPMTNSPGSGDPLDGQITSFVYLWGNQANGFTPEALIKAEYFMDHVMLPATEILAHAEWQARFATP